MAGKGGGAWKVAYADFTTAMMAFFMVMWITAQSEDVKKAVANHFNNPFGKFDSGEAAFPPLPMTYPEGRAATPPKGTAKPDTEGDTYEARKPYTVTLNRGERTIVGAEVLFAEDSAELDTAAQERLKGLVPLLAGKPQKIEIRGHAARKASSPGGKSQDPWQLSHARCLRVMEFLRQEGIPLERMRLSQAGVYEPYSIRDESQRLARNSRVEVFLLSQIAEDLQGTPEEREKRYQTH